MGCRECFGTIDKSLSSPILVNRTSLVLINYFVHSSDSREAKYWITLIRKRFVTITMATPITVLVYFISIFLCICIYIFTFFHKWPCYWRYNFYPIHLGELWNTVAFFAMFGDVRLWYNSYVMKWHCKWPSTF